MNKHRVISYMIFCLCSIAVQQAFAHHVLGRPAYKLNEDSNTPPSMQVETQVGDYFVSYMVYPAFPRANEPGRINLYATRLDGSGPFRGKIKFTVREDGWFADGKVESIGSQILDDNVFRQGFVFSEEGDYIISANFESEGQPYTIDFPLRVGNPGHFGTMVSILAALVALLIGISFIQRKRFMRDKTRLQNQPCGGSE